MVPAQSAKYRVSAGRRSCALSHVDGQVDQSGLHGKPLATPNLDSLGENARETCDVLFSPWTFDGLRHNLSVSEHVSGSCWENSLSSNRPDAWRCMAGNMIHDPCFSGSPRADTVACIDGPFSHSVVLMTLAKALGTSSGTPGFTGKPWALKLSNGSKCSFASGATGVIAGMRLNYYCDNKSWVLGEPDRSSPVWTVLYVASADEPDATQANVEEAMF
jgi:hypothetical protein